MKKLLLTCLLFSHFMLNSKNKDHIEVIFYYDMHYDFPSNDYEPQEKSQHKSSETSQSSSESHSNSRWDSSDYYETIRDRALDISRDTAEARHDYNSSSVDNYDYSQEYRSKKKKKLIICAAYNFFKSQKEYWIGPSKETLKKRDRIAQEKTKKNQQQINTPSQKAFEPTQNIPPVLQNDIEQAYKNHKINCAISDNQNFIATMQQRNLPFEKSLEQQIPTSQQFQLKDSTIGFMQAYNIDHQKFTQLHGLAIQHQLTQELIHNLNAFADAAHANFNNQALFPIIQSGALISGIAQDYNQANKLFDAISATNCSHGFFNYLQAMQSQMYERCQHLATALSFFNNEIANYSFAAARGVAQGIVSSEIASALITGIGTAASTLAPQLTTTIYAGATTIMTPIAIIAGALCSGIIIGELGNLGYLYTTDQMDKLQIEFIRIQNFARQFYNFDQAPTAHVENLAALATTLAWPWQREIIFNNLMNIQNVQCNIYFSPNKVAHYTRSVTQNQLQDALNFINQSELTQFNILYKKIFKDHIFNFYSKSNPGLVVAGMNNLVNFEENIALTQLFIKNDPSQIANAIKAGTSQIILDGISINSEFLTTEAGIKVLQAAEKNYEKKMLQDISKKYTKLLENKAPQEVIDIFCKCQELSIIPSELSTDLEQLHIIFKDRYLGLEEFSSENPYLTMQMRHIFYPNLQPKLDSNYQIIEKFNLKGFHHDEYEFLEQSGLFKFISKTYANASKGAGECFIGTIDWGNGIISNELKTFFPSSWSKEKTAQVIFEATQNRIKFIEDVGLGKKFQCQGQNNILIDIVINDKNVITSAYPSMDNFLGI
ncbi:MAG: hypothetical protein JO129_02095 [Candidatus Dependentiae bacterium]|nr:hypothetical protein [Candidatus Dependentiae bacterium]